MLPRATKERTVEIPCPLLQLADCMGRKGHCHHAPEPLSVTVPRPELRHEAGAVGRRDHTLPRPAAQFSFLFSGTRDPGVSCVSLLPSSLLPSGFSALGGCLRIPPFQINFHIQHRDGKLSNTEHYSEDVAQLSGHDVRACT